MTRDFLSEDLVARLRIMAHRGESIRMMIEEIRNHLGTNDGLAFVIGRYFKEAFYLTVGDVRHIGGCICVGGKSYDDNQIDELLLPLIAASKQKWEEKLNYEANG